jgi:phosphoribosylanthranilate isomerase
MRVKICGLFRPEDIEYVNEALPDYIGFIFAKSRREITMEQAERLKSRLDRRIQTVGVFVDSPLDDVISLIKNRVIDIAQLHGNEDIEYVEQLKFKTGGCEIIKAVRVETAEDIYLAQKSPADFLLLDHGAGGTGEAFDWKLAGKCGKPFFLAGGIHTGNVSLAMKVGKPFAIDLSSGVETDGVKDREKILEIVRRVHND